ncbi:MAG: hypothetical protein J6R47_05690 [Acholeplasmatales bacterium]|nr:hypothetical protein [Acholeplasmatales bacterium]
MKIFGITFITKKDLKKQITRLENELDAVSRVNTQVIHYNEKIGIAYEDMKAAFPFNLGDVVYDIQLRGENGRYTKTKASREHSIVNEVVVDKKNYFKLVDRLGTDVFISETDANDYLDFICIK